MPKTLEEALVKITELTTLNTTLQTDLGKAKTDLTASTKAVKDKDAIITQKNDDIVKLRNSSKDEYKKLEDRTQEEKDKLSEAEIEIIKRQEKLESDTQAFQKLQADAAKKDLDARIDRTVGNLAGKDKELAQKIRDNYGRIMDSAKASTDEEVAKVASEAFNMLGVPKPDGARGALGGGGNGAADGGVGNENNTGFAESQAGKDLSKMMNLPDAPKPVVPPAQQ